MLTVKDIIELPKEEILKKMLKSTSTEQSSDEDTSERKSVLNKIKKELFGWFKADPLLIRRNELLHVGNYFVLISNVVNTSGRVFFTLRGDDKTFSLTKNYLLGETANIDFLRNEIVKYENNLYTIKGVNSASNRLTLLRVNDGFKLTVNANKVEKVPALNE